MTPDILLKIVAAKKREIEVKKAECSIQQIEKAASRADPVRGFKASLKSKISSRLPAVIAEIKKASPSKGVIREDFQPSDIARSYAEAGACCLSVLTDEEFFQGSDTHLQIARESVDLPVLRKDFIIDKYQVYEARSINADCVLLIVSILDDESLIYLHRLAKDLSMDVLVEVHDEAELHRSLAIEPDILGINNRNLRTFDVSLETTFKLMGLVDSETLLVTESGIQTKSDVQKMVNKGVFGFLVGEAFMREARPGDKLRELFDVH